MGGFKTFVQDLTAGLGAASGTPSGAYAANHIDALQAQAQKAKADNLSGLQDAAKAQQIKAAYFTDPNTGKVKTGFEPQYNDAMTKFGDLAGQIYETQHPDPSKMDLPWRLGIRALNKMHLTNDLQSRTAKWQQGEQAYKDQLGEGTAGLPSAMTSAGQLESQKAADALKEIDARNSAAGQKAADALKEIDARNSAAGWTKIGNPVQIDTSEGKKWMQPFSNKAGETKMDAMPDGYNGPAGETDYQKAAVDLRQKTLDLQTAKFNTSRDPNNPTVKAALIRAQQEAERSQAYMIRAQAGAFGAYNGKALPGAQLDSNENPVGSMFAGNVKPTSTEIGRADLATSALEQIEDAEHILRSHSSLFGPGEGRATKMTQWLGTQNPDAQRFTAAVTTAADHLMGVFGGRSSATGQRIEAAMGDFKTNPEATIAALNQFAKAAKTIQSRGTRHVVGGAPGTDVPSGPVNQKNRAAQRGQWSAPADAPRAPKQDGKLLKSGGQVIAVSKNGAWVQP